MFTRFAAGSAIASVVIAVAALVVVLLAPSLPLQRPYLLPAAWCFAPLVWGIWAMIAPAAWVPNRYPVWGAILGLIVGPLIVFVLNIPARVIGEQLPAGVRAFAVVVLVVLYYFLWMLVRLAYRSLHPQNAAR